MFRLSISQSALHPEEPISTGEKDRVCLDSMFKEEDGARPGSSNSTEMDPSLENIFFVVIDLSVLTAGAASTAVHIRDDT